ncbi:hypothetical protein D9M71_93010 [compost metagenome]
MSHRLTNTFPLHSNRPSVCPSIINAGVQALEALGVDLELQQQEWGAALAGLRQGNQRLPAFLVRRFWEVARELSGDPAIGLIAARHSDAGQLLGLAYLMQLMPSRLAGLEVMERYWPLLCGHLRLHYEVEGGRFHLVVLAAQPLQPAAEEIDYWFANQIRYQKSEPGMPTTLLEMRLRRPMPNDPGPWQKITGGAVVFGAERDELLLDLSALRVERTAGSPAVCNALEGALLGYAEQSSQGTLLEQVATAVLAGMQHGLSLERLAERLHMTPRTLHRALLREGWSFSEIVEIQRRYLASDLLREGALDIGEVAEHLGYRELRSFTRAFLRWYGTSPGAFRQERGGG